MYLCVCRVLAIRLSHDRCHPNANKRELEHGSSHSTLFLFPLTIVSPTNAEKRMTQTVTHSLETFIYSFLFSFDRSFVRSFYCKRKIKK
jgi:hypothetical protein